jgi:hypothetical protein
MTPIRRQQHSHARVATAVAAALLVCARVPLRATASCIITPDADGRVVFNETTFKLLEDSWRGPDQNNPIVGAGAFSTCNPPLQHLDMGASTLVLPKKIGEYVSHAARFSQLFQFHFSLRLVLEVEQMNASGAQIAVHAGGSTDRIRPTVHRAHPSPIAGGNRILMLARVSHTHIRVCKCTQS